MCNFIYKNLLLVFQVFPANSTNQEKKMVDNPMLAKLVAKVKTQATPPDNTPPPTPPVIRRNSTNQVPAPGPPSLPGPPPSTLSPPPSQPFLYSPPPPPLPLPPSGGAPTKTPTSLLPTCSLQVSSSSPSQPFVPWQIYYQQYICQGRGCVVLLCQNLEHN